MFAITLEGVGGHSNDGYADDLCHEQARGGGKALGLLQPVVGQEKSGQSLLKTLQEAHSKLPID